MIRIELYEVARRLAGVEAIEVDASTLGGALREAGRRLPALEGQVLADGATAPHWRVSLNGKQFVDDPATPLADGDALLLISALAGG
ncbi:MAG: MoaD/ThiS family protein [Planctomycetota bacterium]